MKNATATASRSAGGCTIKPGWDQGDLLVTCDRKHTATLTYLFPIGHSKVKGTPTAGVSFSGGATVHRSVKVSKDSLRVTVTVTAGTADLSSVSVGYYTG